MAMNDGDALIRELDRDLQEEGQIESLRKQLPWLIAGAIALVLGVASWQIWTSMKKAEAARGAEAYVAAEQTAIDDPLAGLAAFEQIAEEGSPGYSALAAIRAALTQAELGQREDAIQNFLAAAEQPGLPGRFSRFARLKAAQLALEDGRDRVQPILDGLDTEQTPLGAMAREVMGLAALDAGDYGTAEAIFTALQGDVFAPLGAQERAREFAALAKQGEAGVSLEFQSSSQSEALLDLFKNAPGAADSPAGNAAAPSQEDQPATEEPDGAPSETEDGTAGN